MTAAAGSDTRPVFRKTFTHGRARFAAVLPLS